MIIFVVMHIIYSPSSYSSFLEWPQKMDPWLMDIEKIKSNKLYLYEAITAIFMHKSYLHLVGNMVMAFFVMYEL